MKHSPIENHPLSAARTQLGTARPRQGFTLVEMLLSIAIVSIVMVAMAEMLDAVLKNLSVAESRSSQFQESQAAFDSIIRRLSACEINPYYDFVYPGTPQDTSQVPIRYGLESDLHFICGPAAGPPGALIGGDNHPGHAIFFHGAYGFTDTSGLTEMGTLLNSWGYHLEFGDDAGTRADFLNAGNASPSKYRYRLKELQVPAELLQTYTAKLNEKTTEQDIYGWFRSGVNGGHSHTLAENIVALVITPLVTSQEGAPEKATELAPDYFYDTRAYQHNRGSQELMERTRHKLPPLVRITLVALSETSAQTLAETHGDNMPPLYPASLFTDVTKYESDLAALEANLVEQKLRYRVFTSTVRLRNSKWTSNP
ncbi:Verru_Chthon cassette protein C [Roseimicrobium gellanilyticum]|nr:Verru_Chthon cassette protein C [Roseimicrobium gellanilyticum]